MATIEVLFLVDFHCSFKIYSLKQWLATLSEYQVFKFFLFFKNQCFLSRSESESSRTPSEALRRPAYHTQRSAPVQVHEGGHRQHHMSASAGTKVKRDDIFGSVKRRRTTPPGWTGFQNNSVEYNNHVLNGGRIRQEDDEEDDGSEELLGPEEEAQGNLVSPLTLFDNHFI